MDELLLTRLNKNVSGIIIRYLTDPPELPFLMELKNKTSWIKQDSDWCYTNYYVTLSKYKQKYKTQIKKSINCIGQWGIYTI